MEGYEKEGKNIVYLDESGFEKETLRAYGWAMSPLVIEFSPSIWVQEPKWDAKED